jgi:rhomboid protease GluP
LELSPRIRYKFDRYKQKFNDMFSSGQDEEKPRPRLCPNCGTLVGATATKCYSCGANVNFGMAAARKSLGRWLPAESPVTYLILCVTCIWYAISFALTVRLSGGGQGPGGVGFSALMSLGGISPKALIVLGGSLPWPNDFHYFPWRLIMPTLLHGGLLHIGFNMWVLMDVGPQLEELYGSARYLFIYFLTGMGAYIVSGYFNSVVAIGASGALLGLIGVMLAITTKRQGEHMRMLRSSLIRWLVYIAVLGLVMGGVDNWAHGGGLVTGLLAGRVMADRAPLSPAEDRIAKVLGWGTGIVVLGCMAFSAYVLFLVMSQTAVK